MKNWRRNGFQFGFEQLRRQGPDSEGQDTPRSSAAARKLDGGPAVVCTDRIATFNPLN